MTVVYVALGSNLGHRAGNLQRAVDLLPSLGVAVERVSGIWETAPVPADQPAFLNAAVAGATGLSPVELLGALKRIEGALGRRPERRWGPRPVDLDILLYGDLELRTPDLTIPHALLTERAFVLAPLVEVAGGLHIRGTRILDLLADLQLGGVWRTGFTLKVPGSG